MPFESVVSLPSRACLYPCRPSFHTPHSGRCHALDMINCRRYDGWRAENLGIKRMTDEAPVRLWCRVHAHVHAVRLSIMHVTQTLRIAAMPVTPATVVATAVSFVVALGGEISSLPRWCVMFPDATLSHTPLHCLFRARRAWGEAPCLTGQDLSPI
jgi:hypothetical protein